MKFIHFENTPAFFFLVFFFTREFFIASEMQKMKKIGSKGGILKNNKFVFID